MSVCARYLSVISDEDEPSSDGPLEIIEEDPAGDRSVPLDAALQRDSALAVFFGEGASASDQAELQHLYRAAVERCRGELSDYGVAVPAGQSLDEFCRRTKETVASVRSECAAQLQQERARHREQVSYRHGDTRNEMKNGKRSTKTVVILNFPTQSIPHKLRTLSVLVKRFPFFHFFQFISVKFSAHVHKCDSPFLTFFLNSPLPMNR